VVVLVNDIPVVENACVAPTGSEGLGPLESEVMDILWARDGPVTVRDVLERVNTRRSDPLAYTTVMTVLSRLHDKGHVTRERRGRGYVYAPARSEDELIDDLGRRDVDRLVDRYGEVALAHFAQRLREADPRLLAEAIRVSSGGATSPSRRT
jgi:predicted transcriptional regulator